MPSPDVRLAPPLTDTLFRFPEPEAGRAASPDVFLSALLLRLFDLAVALPALAATLLLSIPIALAIKLEGKTPVLYSQTRPGLRGRPFRLWKFCTMVTNGDELLEAYLAKNRAARKEWKKYRKLKGFDPRVTVVGRFLRRFSLDELPQFLNVVRGDMSLVGPRPYLALEFVDYGLDPTVLERILSVKPGLTGLWQTMRRNDASFLERVELDHPQGDTAVRLLDDE